MNVNGGLVNVGAAGTSSSGPATTDATALWLDAYGGTASAINLTAGTLSTARPIANGTANPAYVNFNGGTLQAAAGGFNILNSGLTVSVQAGGATIDTSGFNTTVTAPLLNGGGGGLTKLGAGTLTLSSTSSSAYIGGTTINNGTLSVTSDNQLGNSSGSLAFGGGTLLVGGSGTAFATSRNVTLNAAGTIDAGNAANTAVFSGNLAIGGNLLTLQGAGNGTYAGIIGSDNGSGGLFKTGSSTWVLTSPNTYTGATTVNAGKLYFNNSATSGAVSVNSGATLGGSGSVSGAVTVNSGGLIDAGFQGAGQLTLGGLTFNGGSTVHVGGQYPASPAVNVTGALAANGAPGSVVINIDGSLAASGTYALIGFGSLNPAQSTAFALGATPATNARQTGILQDTGDMLIWNVVGGYPIWTGVNGSLFSGGNNWKLSTDGSATDFIPGDTVVFDDSASGFTVNVSGTGNVSPLSVTFSQTGTYTLQGSFGIAGTGTLLKNNTGTLVITNTNGFTGGSTLSAGLVQVGNNLALGAGVVNMNGAALSAADTNSYTLANNFLLAADTALGDPVNNGSLAFAGSVDLGGTARTLTVNSPVTISGVVTDGGLIKAGSGQLTLSAANAYAGSTVVNAGTLLISGTGSLAGGGAVLNAGLLQVGSNTALGSGTLTLNSGQLSSDGATARALSNPVVFGGNVALGDPLNNGSLTLAGAVNLGGSSPVLTINSPVTISGLVTNGGLTKTGSATLLLSGSNTYAGGTTLTAGVLQVGNNAALGSGTVALNAGQFSSSGAAAYALSNPVVVGGNVTLGDPLNNGGLTFSGAVGLGGATQTLTVDSPVTISGLVTNGGLTKTGSGTLVLTNYNTFSGPTTINAGTIQIGDGSTQHANYGLYSGGSGTITVNSGGTLLFRSIDAFGQAGSGSVNKNISIVVNPGGMVTNGTWTGAYYNGVPSAGFNTLYNLHLSGGTLRGVGALNGNSAVTPWGAFNIVGTLLIDGTVQLTISEAAPGDSDYIGPNGFMCMDNGTTTFNVLHNTTGVDLFVSASLRNYNGGTSGLAKTGAGTMQLAASDNNYTGATTVSGGALVLTGSLATGSGANRISVSPAAGAAASLSINGGLLSANATTAPSLQAGTVSGGSAAVNLTAGALGTASDVWLGTASGAGGVLNVSGGAANIGGNLSIGANAGSQGQATVSGGTLAAAGSIYVGQNGTGTLDVSGTARVVSGATLSIGQAISGGGTVELDGGTLTAPGVATAGGGTSILNFNGGTLQASASNGAFILGLTQVNVRNGGAVIDTSGFNIMTGQVLAHSPIGGDNATDGGLTKAGNGTLTLTAADTFNGTTEITGGTLALANGAALQNSTLDTSASGTLNLSALTSGTLGGITGAGNLGLVAGSSGISLSVGNNNANTTFSGSVAAGLSSLNKIGSGTLTLSGTIATTGGSSVNAGTLVLNGALGVADLYVKNAAQLAGSGTINVTGGDGLFYQSSAASTFGGTLSGSQLEIASGSLTLGGSANSFGGGTNIDIPSARLTLAAAGALPAGTAAAIYGTLDLGSFNASTDTLNGTGKVDNLSGSGGNTLTIGLNGGSSTFSGTIQNTAGSLALYKTGSGTFTLTGPNTYAGGTTMNNGMLVLANTSGSALGTGTLTLNGGTLDAGAAGGTINGLVQAGSAAHTIAPGAGLSTGYGTLNLIGGLNTNASTTLAFNMNLGSPIGGSTYGGDLVNLGGSPLTVSGGSITFDGNNPTASGDYRLFSGSNFGSPVLTNFTLPVQPNETYSLSTSVDSGFIDLVVAGAATFSGSATWVGTTASWSSSGNWTDGKNAGVPGDGTRPADTAAFSGSGSTTINLDMSPSLAAMSFSGTNYTLSGSGTLTLSNTGTGTAAVVVSYGTQTIASGVVAGHERRLRSAERHASDAFGPRERHGGPRLDRRRDAGLGRHGEQQLQRGDLRGARHAGRQHQRLDPGQHVPGDRRRRDVRFRSHGDGGGGRRGFRGGGFRRGPGSRAGDDRVVVGRDLECGDLSPLCFGPEAL